MHTVDVLFIIETNFVAAVIYKLKDMKNKKKRDWNKNLSVIFILCTKYNKL